MAKAGELKFVITVDSSGAVKSINTVGDSTEKLEEKTKKANKSLGNQVKQFLKIGSVLVAAKLAYNLVSDSISLASDAMEEHSKLNAIFSEQAKAVTKTVGELTSNYGLSTLAAEKMLAATGDLLTGLGLNQKEALSLSEQTQKLAVDLASFTNFSGGAKGASEALTKAMLGERESIKSLGISILEAEVQQRLLEKGQGALAGTALKAAKAQATLELAMEQSKNAMGDFERTQDSFANQTRQLEADIEDIRVEFGKAFIKMLMPFLRDFAAWIDENSESIIAFFDGLIKALGGVAAAIKFAGTAGAKFMTAVSDLGKTQEEGRLISQGHADEIAAWAEEMFNAEKQTEGTTGAIINQSRGLTEVEKIMKRYGITMLSANAILKAQNPELEEIEKLQKELKISLEEATKVYGILNQLEEDRKNTIKETNEELPKLIITNNDLDQALSDLVAEMDEVERKQGELNEGFLEEAEAIADVSEATEGYINELSFLEKAYRSIKESGETFGNVLQGLGRLSFIPDQMAKSFMGLGDTIARAASGDMLGALSSGVSFLTGLFGKDGLTGQIEFATEALRKFGITGKEEIEAVAKAMEDFADSFSMKDILADPEAYFDGLKAAGEEAAEEIAKSTSQWFEPIRDTIPDLEKFLAVPAKNAEEFNAQTTITLGTFANMLKSGLSITEALTQMDGVFDKLIASQEALGIEGDKTFEALKEFRGLVKGNQELVDSVEGLNAVMEATAALGELSQDQIDAFGTSAKSKFDDLIDAGFSQNQALTLIGPTLLQLKENAEKYGLELDANTQKMIEQAEASGVFDEMADPMDKLVDILEKIFVQLGGNMDELTDFGEAGEAAASKASDAQGELQSSIEGTGMVAADASKTMADSMEHAIDSVSRDMINLEDVTADVMTTMSEDANAAATDMQNSFVDASKNSLDAIRGLAAGAKNSLSGLGGAGAASQPPLLQQRRGIPGFSTGGSGIVPPGFNNDNYLVGLSSGEPFSVGSTSNSTTNNNTDNMNITLKQEITKEDSVDSIALKTIAALKEKRFGLDKEIKNAIGVS